MKSKKMLRHLVLAFTLAISSVSLSLPIAAQAQVGQCDLLFKKSLEEQFPNTKDVVDAMEQFAAENNLPTQVIEVGPHKAKRYLVGLDVTNKDLINKYITKFNMETELTPTTPGVLALEFQHEIPNQYVTGVLRRYPGHDRPIYRWGKHDLTYDNWWKSWIEANSAKKPIWAYSHIIGLSKAELDNVKIYLDKPEERGPCKADNCVAWTANIELKRTAKDAKPEERGHLLNELGVSRSMAHFEIARRLFNAANQRHTGIFIFYNGAEGLKAFNEKIKDHIPALPQIPIETIIKGQNIVRKDLQDALSVIPEGAKVFLPIAAGASPEAVEGLITRAKEMNKGIDLHVFVNGVSEATFRKGVETTDGKLRLTALFLGSNLRKLYREGRVEVIPGYLRDAPLWIKDPLNQDFKYQAVIVRVSPPDAQGRYSLGPNADIVQTVIESTPGIKIIAK